MQIAKAPGALFAYAFFNTAFVWKPHC